MSLESASDGSDRPFSFDEVAAQLRARGIALVGKAHCRFEGFDQCPPFLGGEPVAVDEPELAEPEFWIPVGFDGYRAGWPFLCAPPWMTKDQKALAWLDEFAPYYDAWPDHGEFSEDSPRFVRTNLSTLRCFAKFEGKPNPLAEESEEERRVCAASKIGKTYLEEAMVQAYAVDGGTPPRTLESLREGESLRLSPQIARIIEAAFRAGRADAYASALYRGIDSVAREGMRWISKKGQKGKRTGTRDRWLGRAEEILAGSPTLKPRRVLDQLEKEGYVQRKGREWDEGVIILETRKEKSWDAASQAIRRKKPGRSRS